MCEMEIMGRYDPEKELGPCPFCGGKAVLSYWGMHRAWCVECKAKTEDFLLQRDAIKAWNRRADDGKR